MFYAYSISLVCVCGVLENPIEYTHPLALRSKQETRYSQKISHAHGLQGKACFAMPTCNYIKSTKTRWKNITRAVALYHTLFCRPMTS